MRRRDRRRWAPVDARGLIAPGKRKSIGPLAHAVRPGEPVAARALHHVVSTAPWDLAPLEARIAAEAERLAGGPGAVPIVDVATLPKTGTHSVGVAHQYGAHQYSAHQYGGALGKQATCRTLVSRTPARGEVPVPLALRLFLTVPAVPLTARAVGRS